MINKRLIQFVSESRIYILKNVIYQWIALIANIIFMYVMTLITEKLYKHTATLQDFLMILGVGLCVLIIRILCSKRSVQMSYESSKEVKKKLRYHIYQKLLNLGTSYNENMKTSEIVQIAVEGVNQLETYFGSYLPQFFYAMLAPMTLFVVLCFVNVSSALILLVCVPLIPISIILVSKWAKKLLSKYWGQYTALGDTFLENLQGLTTLKIYQSDAYRQTVMNEEAEKFRKITMKVLTMQLNSITIMDIVAYGGAAIGMIVAITQYHYENVSLSGCLLIILLSAEFFIPMRLLGSFFHIAMNGMSASEKIFYLLDLPEEQKQETIVQNDYTIICEDISFSYDKKRKILNHVHVKFSTGSFVAIVGESGSGKSTFASLLIGQNKYDQGILKIGQQDLHTIDDASLMQYITYVSHHSYLFKGTVRENLLMGNNQATDDMLWNVLKQVKLADFLMAEDGLDTLLQEKASNLSGGQCQRLALARALLHDSPIYIFDEATSNIDIESENDIMQEIHRLAKTKTVILISHRLMNVKDADCIYVMDKGCLVEEGKHEELLQKNQVYANLWETQQILENYGKEDIR